MSKRNSLFCYYMIGLLVTNLSAVEIMTGKDNFKLSVNGTGSFYFGQVGRGTGIENTGPVNDLWIDNASAGLWLEANIDNKLSLVLGIDAEMKFSWPMETQFSQTKTAQPVVSLRESYGLYTLGWGWGSLDICAGYFGYKYNPDVRNLGEYLFRSATYPAYIITNFDDPKAKLLGLRIGTKLFDSSLSQDVILSSETVFYPAMDWSLSYLLSYNLLNLDFISIGAGVSWAHLFSVYDNSSPSGSATSPKSKGAQGNQYLTADGDTAYYTFKGSKLMSRISISPLAFISQDNSFFLKSDFRIYGELLVIGLKSYPDTTLSGKQNPSYSDWKEKAPVTFGINIPTFKLLDVLSLEFEYWGSKYYNDYRQIYVVDGKPTPPALNENVKEAKWKWSVYFKKSFFNEHCSITTQFARDHMRMFDALYDKANHREMLVEDGNWWWVTKLGFSF